MKGPDVPAAVGLWSSPEPALPRGEIFEVLSNGRRRQVLHYLKRQEDRQRIELRELVDHVAAWENDVSVDEVDADERKRVYTALRQSHLPKMDEAGVIEYDNMRGEVLLTDRAREAQLYLEYVPSEDIPWSHCYLGVTGVCSALVGLVGLDVGPFGGLPWIALCVLIVATFGVTSAAHALQSSRNRLGSDEFALSDR